MGVARPAGGEGLGETGASLHDAPAIRSRSRLAFAQPSHGKGARLQHPSSDQASRLRSAERRSSLGQLGDIKALTDEVGER